MSLVRQMQTLGTWRRATICMVPKSSGMLNRIRPDGRLKCPDAGFARCTRTIVALHHHLVGGLLRLV